VGHRGSRVQAVVNELYDEKIDIIRWSSDIAQFVAEALSPAKVTSVQLTEATKTAFVIVPDTQLSLAIGKCGQNVRLAARLTGCRIDIRSETQAAKTGSERTVAPTAEPDSVAGETIPDEPIVEEATTEGPPLAAAEEVTTEEPLLAAAEEAPTEGPLPTAAEEAVTEGAALARAADAVADGSESEPPAPETLPDAEPE